MNTFVINGTRYTAPKFDYNTVCELDEMGASLDKIKDHAASVVRAYFAVCLDGDKVKAGDEINAHLIAGGSLNDLMTAMAKEIDESDFFRAINKTAAATPQPKKAKAKEDQ